MLAKYDTVTIPQGQNYVTTNEIDVPDGYILVNVLCASGGQWDHETCMYFQKVYNQNKYTLYLKAAPSETVVTVWYLQFLRI